MGYERKLHSAKGPFALDGRVSDNETVAVTSRRYRHAPSCVEGSMRLFDTLFRNAEQRLPRIIRHALGKFLDFSVIHALRLAVMYTGGELPFGCSFGT